MKRLIIIIASVFLLLVFIGPAIYAEESTQQERIDRILESLEDQGPSYVGEEDLSSLESSSKEKTTIDSIIEDEVKQVESIDDDEEYWNKDIREQKIGGIQEHLKIDEAYKEYKQIEAVEAFAQEIRKAKTIEETRVLTPSDIILNVIDPKYHNKKMDLDFDETSLNDIVMTLSEAGDMNIVLDPALKKKKLDLNLKQVTIKNALLLISKSYNLGFQQVERSLYITNKENLKDQNRVSKVIKIHNINVEEAKLLIENLDVKSDVSQEINSLVVVGEPEDIVNAEKVIRQIDKPQPQVILEAKIIEVNKDALKDFGVDWSDSATLAFQESGRPADFDNEEDATESVANVARFQRSPVQFSAVIKMLENQNKAKVLSNPRVTTLNDKEAEIFVGDRIPYTITNVTGGVATTDVRWVEPGIRLSITPSIIDDDFVVIKVEPEVSFIFSYRGPNDEFPHVKTREATAYVRVKNNQPFILGGLLNQEDKKNLYKVPFFGSIPLIGNLFSYEKHTVTDTELIITIIPTVVNGIQ